MPVDDTHYRLFHAGRVPENFVPREPRNYDGRLWSQLSEDEHQRFPGDWEAQVGQGPISLHSEEHLATSDQRRRQLRRMMRRQIKKVGEGGDPMGVAFDRQATVQSRPAISSEVAVAESVQAGASPFSGSA